MNYDFQAVQALYASLPLHHLRDPVRAQRWLEHLVEVGGACSEVLSQYPKVRYQPLDAHYVLARALATLNAQLLEDLVDVHGPRGRLFASLLLVLSRETPPAAGVLAVSDAIPALRTHLGAIHCLPHPLKLAASELTQRAHQEAVRFAYRNHGVSGAMEVIRNAARS